MTINLEKITLRNWMCHNYGMISHDIGNQSSEYSVENIQLLKDLKAGSFYLLKYIFITLYLVLNFKAEKSNCQWMSLGWQEGNCLIEKCSGNQRTLRDNDSSLLLIFTNTFKSHLVEFAFKFYIDRPPVLREDCGRGGWWEIKRM